MHTLVSACVCVNLCAMLQSLRPVASHAQTATTAAAGAQCAHAHCPRNLLTPQQASSSPRHQSRRPTTHRPQLTGQASTNCTGLNRLRSKLAAAARTAHALHPRTRAHTHTYTHTPRARRADTQCSCALRLLRLLVPSCTHAQTVMTVRCAYHVCRPNLAWDSRRQPATWASVRPP